LAANYLTTAATNVVTQFIGEDTLEMIAPLPDNYDHSPIGKWSSPCHYVDMPRGAANYSASDCGKCCVVGAIQNYTKILTKEASNPFMCDFDASAEPCALEFLVHYVGDIHQPLHVGYADDEGGNKVSVTFFGTRSNLHKVWDDDIILRWHKDVDSAVTELQAYINNNPDVVQEYVSYTNPIEWADESWAFTTSVVYVGIPTLGETYYDSNLPIIQQRLVAAGVRLGNLFNNVLSSSSDKIATSKALLSATRVNHIKIQ